MSAPVGARVFTWADHPLRPGPDAVRSFGFGTYVGNHPRPDAEAWVTDERQREVYADAIARSDERYGDYERLYRDQLAAGQITREEHDRAVRWHREQSAKSTAQRVDEVMAFAALSPKIVLDGGRGVVWGCECWWDALPEGMSDERWLVRVLRGRELVLVDAPHPAEDDTTEVAR